jgi:hypothetical protein
MSEPQSAVTISIGSAGEKGHIGARAGAISAFAGPAVTYQKLILNLSG